LVAWVLERDYFKTKPPATAELAIRMAAAVKYLLTDLDTLSTDGKELLKLIREQVRDEKFGWTLHDRLFGSDTDGDALRELASKDAPIGMSGYTTFMALLPSLEKLNRPYLDLERRN